MEQTPCARKRSFYTQKFPDTIDIFEGPYGMSIRAKVKIPKYKVIDESAPSWFINNEDYDFDLHLSSRDMPITLNTFRNTLYFTETERTCNGYIGLFNHSCHRSNICFSSTNKFTFNVIASRDIEPGDELLCNYMLFDYTGDGHEFMCNCGGGENGDSCFGRISGYRSLSIKTQLRLVDSISENVLHAFASNSFDSNRILSDYTFDGYRDSFTPAISLNTSETPIQKLHFRSLKIDISCIERVKIVLRQENIPPKILYLFAFLLMIEKINSSRMMCQLNDVEDRGTRRTLHLLPENRSSSVMSCLLAAAIRLDPLGPPARVVKHIMKLENLEISHAMSFYVDIGMPEAADLHLVFAKDFIEWRYSSRYDMNMIIEIDESYAFVLDQLTSNLFQEIRQVQMVGGKALQNVLYDWNHTLKPVSDKFIFEYLTEHASANPEKIAVESNNGSLTYEELDLSVTRLAGALQGSGVMVEDIVGIMMPRCCNLIVAMLGVLKSGGAYTGLLPDYPIERLKYIVEEDCRCKVVVTVVAFQDMFTWFRGKLVFVDRLDSLPDDLWMNSCVTFSNLAYITYTSGSTGQPKGVMIEHGHFMRYYFFHLQPKLSLFHVCKCINCRYTMAEAYNLDVDKYLCSTSLTFDIIVLETFVPLISNKTVYVAENIMSPNIPCDIGFIQGPSSVLEATLIQLHTESGDLIKMHVSQVGEKLTSKVIDKFGQVINGYGTAETVAIAACKIVSKDDDFRIVGKPHTFSFIYILDSDLNPLPVNIPGDIYIGGPVIARGYLNNPELTELKFIANRFAPGRMYRTGDIGKWTSDGELFLLGRRDSQIKRNGVRIELGEIECATEKCEGVEKSVCTFNADTKELNLYWTGVAHSDNVKSFLRLVLPSTMYPSHFMNVPSFALMPNGKLDRSTLPLPYQLASVLKAPDTIEEVQMHKIWKSLLSLTLDFSTRDHFFEIGGDSLKLQLLLYKVKDEFKVPLKVSDIYANDTVESLVAFIQRSRALPVIGDNGTRVVSYYQLHNIMWYTAQMTITIRLLTPANLTSICTILIAKYPILGSNIKRKSVEEIGKMSFADIHSFQLWEFGTICDLPIETYDASVSVLIDPYEKLSRLFIDASSNTIVMILSHVAFDGYSLGRLLSFIDSIACDNESTSMAGAEDFIRDNQEINISILTSYDSDMNFWANTLSNYKPGPGNYLDSVPFDVQALKHLNPFEIMKFINDLLDFDVIFYIDTFNLRSNFLSCCSNGCLVTIEKFSSVALIEKVFHENVKHSSVPIYLLLTKFNPKNIVYLNYTNVVYEGYSNIKVDWEVLETSYETIGGHWILYVKYWTADDIEVKLCD